MDSLPPGISPAELLAQRGWIERLAYSLLRDPDKARDVAQDACLIAIERPPREAVSGRRLSAWLASVTRTLARQLARGEGRRVEREQRALHEGLRSTADASSALDVVLRGALQQRVAQAVLELAEPCRSAVMLRYLDGLDAPTIARRQGITPAAARKRISRGLEALRVRLEDELEDRGGLAGLVVLSPALHVNEAPSAATILTMSTTLKLSLSVAAVAAGLVLAVSLSRSLGSDAPELSRATDSEALAGLEPATQKSGGTGPSQSEPSRVAVGSSSASTAQTAPQQDSATGWSLRARLLDERGWPLEGALLHVADIEGRADRDGRVELELEAPLPLVDDELPGSEPTLVVTASAPGHRGHRWYVVPGEPRAIELGELRLHPIDTLRGRVIDEAGRPLAEVYVIAVAPELGTSSRRELELFGPDYTATRASARTDKDGEFELKGMSPGRWRVWACPQGMLFAFSGVIVVEEGAIGELIELVARELPPGNRIEGVVLDEEGAPVPDIGLLSALAHVDGGRADFGHVGSTDAEGRFRLAVRSGTHHDLRAEDLRSTRASSTVRAVAAGETGLVLRMAPPRFITVYVNGHEGRPTRSASVVSRAIGEESIRTHWPRRGGQAGEIQVLVRETSFLLEVRGEGLLMSQLGPFDPSTAPDELRCTLERAARVRGRVTGGGKPIPRAVVQLVRTRSSNRIDHIQGFPTRLDGTGLQGVQADAEGRFELPITKPREYVLFAEAEGWAATELGPLLLDPRRDEELDIELSAGGALEGRVIVPQGESPAGVALRFSRGDARVHKTHTDEDGQYRIEALTPGRWMVRATRMREVERRGAFGSLVDSFEVPENYELPWDCEVFAGQVTRHDVDLAEQDVATLEGRLTIAGEPTHRCAARVRPESEAWSPPPADAAFAQTGLDGSFRIEKLALGKQVLLLAPAEGPLRQTRLVLPLDLRRGANRVELELATAPLTIRAPDRPAGATMLLARLESGAVALREVELDATGELGLPAFPAGEVELHVVPIDGRRADPLTWDLVASAVLDPNEAGELR